MTAHTFVLEHYSMGVSKGSCSCGAVKFFANALWPVELQKRADKLNQKYGIEKVHEGEEVMAVVEVKEMSQMSKQEIERRIAGSGEIKLLPVPPRPTGNDNQAIKAYYNANKAQILSEVKQYGEKKTRKRWNVPYNSWNYLLMRWDKEAATTKPILKHGAQLGNRNAKKNKIAFPEFDPTWSPEQMQTWFDAREKEMART
jgi:hypothetical protein